MHHKLWLQQVLDADVLIALREPNSNAAAEQLKGASLFWARARQSRERGHRHAQDSPVRQRHREGGAAHTNANGTGPHVRRRRREPPGSRATFFRFRVLSGSCHTIAEAGRSAVPPR